MPPPCDSDDGEEAVLMLTLAATGDTTYCCLRCAAEAVAAMANTTDWMRVSVEYAPHLTAPAADEADPEAADANGTEGSGRGRRKRQPVPAVPAEPEGGEPPAPLPE